MEDVKLEHACLDDDSIFGILIANNLYALTCFPNGLVFFPRKFTNLLKPVYSVYSN